MPIHERILAAVLRICRERGGWTFAPHEIVAALGDLNAGSVRTHIMSRCCVNAPAHHAHRWEYFRRVRRGVYELLPAWRRRPGRGPARVPEGAGDDRPTSAGRLVFDVRESGAGYSADIHGGGNGFRSASLDEVAARAREACRRRRVAIPSVPASIRLHVDLEPERPDPVIEAYEKGVDRTLVRQGLRMGFEERLLALQNWMNDTEEIRGAARRWRRRTGR